MGGDNISPFFIQPTQNIEIPMKIDKKELINNLSNIWVVEIVESELGWSSNVSVELFDSYSEAISRKNKINEENTSDEAPDYYIVATKVELFLDYYKIRKQLNLNN
jgi:5-formaminoimidazole-4-carboxamide-1-beta-D-ribofuranosyl 5'-monophosphate synthetase